MIWGHFNWEDGAGLKGVGVPAGEFGIRDRASCERKGGHLHWFDALFYGPQGPARKADVKLVRYADDFVALAKQMGSETVEFIESRLEGKFHLEINREKTRVVDLVVELREQRASPDFLGIHVPV